MHIVVEARELNTMKMKFTKNVSSSFMKNLIRKYLLFDFYWTKAALLHKHFWNRVTWAKITYLKSHTIALDFCLQTDM